LSKAEGPDAGARRVPRGPSFDAPGPPGARGPGLPRPRDKLGVGAERRRERCVSVFFFFFPRGRIGMGGGGAGRKRPRKGLASRAASPCARSPKITLSLCSPAPFHSPLCPSDPALPPCPPAGHDPAQGGWRKRGGGGGRGQKKGEEARRKGGGLKKRKGLAPHSFASPRASSSSAACGDCSSVHPSEPDARNSALGAVPASQYQGLQSEPEGEAIRP